MIGRSFFSFSRKFSSEAFKKRNSLGRLISLNKETKPTSGKLIQSTIQQGNSVYPIIAACTAESYDFSKLLPFLQKNFQLSPFICDEVLHVQMPVKRGEVFFFKNGSLVFWSNEAGVDEDVLLKSLNVTLLPTIKEFEVSPFSKPDFEELSYKYTTSSK